MTKSISTSVPKIQVIDNQPVTSSLDVAKYFGKQHKDVLKVIQTLDLPEDFGQRNFAPTSYIDQWNREQPAYNMTKDGFVFLVMGFTGKRATQFKIDYINQFNAMEAALRGGQQDLFGQPAIDTPSTKEDRKPLTNLINSLVSCAPITHRDAWHMVHAHMGGKHADELTLSEVQTAIEFVQSKIDLYCASPVTDFITEQALAGTAAFSIRLSVEQDVTSRAKAVKREFRANIYILEEPPKHEIATYIEAKTQAFNRQLTRSGIR